MVLNTVVCCIHLILVLIVFGDNGIKDLANVFKDCSKLHTLDIHFNDIGADGTKYLAGGIKHCSMLHTLDIHFNHIGADGAKYLADGIKH